MIVTILMVKYELDEDFSTETAVEFGRVYNKDGNET
jgi:tellurium resistance protein TerD